MKSMIVNFHKIQNVLLVKSLIHFFGIRGHYLAATSLFYLTLTFVPLFLLIVRLFCWVIGEDESVTILKNILNKIFVFSPEVIPNFLSFFETSFFSNSPMTLFNIVVVLIFVNSFFNSFNYAVQRIMVLKYPRKKFESWKIFTGPIFIVVIILSLLVIVLLNVLKNLDKIFPNDENIFLSDLFSLIPKIAKLKENFAFHIDFNKFMNMMTIFKSYGVDILSMILVSIFWSFFFWWIFYPKAKLKSCFYGAIIFLFLLMGFQLGTQCYLDFVSPKLLEKLGTYFSIYLVLFSPYILLNFLYFSMCVVFVSTQKDIENIKNKHLHFKKSHNYKSIT